MTAGGAEGPRIVEVLGVYDADGGLRGEAAYVLGSLLGRAHCSLCDITHSPVRRKRAWRALVDGLGPPVRTAHRNELTAEEEDAVARAGLPVVLGRRSDGRWVVLVGPDELDAMGGSVGTLEARLRAAVDEGA